MTLEKRTRAEQSALLSLRRPAMLFVLACLVLLGICFFRIYYVQTSEMRLGDEALQERDLARAIFHYRHAIESHIPLGAKGAYGIAKLKQIADECEEKGDLPTALFALRSARMGIMATAHLGQPHGDEISGINARIGTLMVQQTSADDPGVEVNLAQRFQVQLSRADERRRDPLLGFLGAVLFLGWLGSLFVLAWRGFDRTGRPTSHMRLVIPVSAALLALSLWMFWWA